MYDLNLSETDFWNSDIEELNALIDRQKFHIQRSDTQWARLCAILANAFTGKQHEIADFMPGAKTEQSPEDMLAVIKKLDAGLR